MSALSKRAICHVCSVHGGPVHLHRQSAPGGLQTALPSSPSQPQPTGAAAHGEGLAAGMQERSRSVDFAAALDVNTHRGLLAEAGSGGVGESDMSQPLLTPSGEPQTTELAPSRHPKIYIPEDARASSGSCSQQTVLQPCRLSTSICPLHNPTCDMPQCFMKLHFPGAVVATCYSAS